MKSKGFMVGQGGLMCCNQQFLFFFFSYPLSKNSANKTANMGETLVCWRLGWWQRERTTVGERMDDIDVVGARA